MLSQCRAFSRSECRGNKKTSTEEMANSSEVSFDSSEVSFDSSEVSFDSSEVSFDSSEVLFLPSVENFHFPVSYWEDSSMGIGIYRYNASALVIFSLQRLKIGISL